jgi:hypothetical protein
MQRWIARETSRETSRGATALLLHMLSLFTRSGFLCSLIDTGGSFDCIKAEVEGMMLDRVLWIRCKRNQEWAGCRSHGYTHKNKELIDHSNHYNKPDNHWQQVRQSNQVCPVQTSRSQRLTSLERAFKAADILLHAGGFALIVVDLSSIDKAQLRKIPLTTWFRFARVADETETELVFLTSAPIADSCTGLRLHIGSGSASWSSNEEDETENCCAARDVDVTVNKGRNHLHEFRKSTERYLPNIEPVWRKIQQQGTNRSSVQNNAAARSTYPWHITVLHALRPECEVMRNKKSVQHVHIQSIKAPVWRR